MTDNHPQFMSKDFHGFLEERKITHCVSSVYYPQANVDVERWNSVLKNAVQSAVVKKENIKENVLKLLACYRATPHATTGEKPCKLLHGRDMRTKLDIAGFQKKQKEVDQQGLLRAYSSPGSSMRSTHPGPPQGVCLRRRHLQVMWVMDVLCHTNS